MGWGSGVFSRLYNWVSDRDANINITASRMDAEMNDMATGITECINKDGENEPSVNLPMGGFRHTSVGTSSDRTMYARTDQVQDSSFNHASDTGAANAYVVGMSPSIGAYAAGQRFTFIATNANTGASTLAVNGLTAQTIQTWYGSALPAGAIAASQVVDVVYDGTNFILLSGLVSADIAAIIGLTSSANKLIRYTGSNAADLIDFFDEDDMSSDSNTAVPSQQSTKAYVDSNLGMPVRSDSTTETLTAAQANSLTISSLTAAITKTLPALSGVQDGAMYTFKIIGNSGNFVQTIVPSGADNIQVYNVSDHDNFYLQDIGDFVSFVADTSNTTWRIVSDGAMGPYFYAEYDGAGQAMLSNTDTKMAFNTEENDYWSIFSTSNNRGTPNVPGVYRIDAGCYILAAAETRCSIQLWKNGAFYESGNRVHIDTDGALDTFIVSSWEVELNGSTDYIEIYARTFDTTGTFDDPIESYFKCRRIR